MSLATRATRGFLCYPDGYGLKEVSSKLSLGIATISLADLRRNILVIGLNLLGLRKRQFKIGTAILEGTGLCAPCSRMEETFGAGGYSAVRGHGGITATIIKPGDIQIGDKILPL